MTIIGRLARMLTKRRPAGQRYPFAVLDNPALASRDEVNRCVSCGAARWAMGSCVARGAHRYPEQPRRRIEA